MLTFKLLVAADLVTRAAPDTDEVEDARMGCPMRLTVVEDVRSAINTHVVCVAMHLIFFDITSLDTQDK
jgi:hypothetical protein